MSVLALKILGIVAATLMFMAASTAFDAGFNYTGAATLIVAIGGVITIIGTVLMQILNYIRQGHVLAQQEQLLSQGQSTHDLVDGVSKELQAATKKADFADGVEAERSRDTPAHP
jgi:hypothetical protein